MQSLTQHIVAEAAEAAGISVPARFVEVTGSTNSDLAELAARGAPAWTVVVAGQQEAGRGRLGRSWVSRPGDSLLVSVLLRPRLDPSEAPVLSLAAAVAAAEACAVAAVDARCKWPNDIVVGDRKLAGILPEAAVVGGRLEHVVIGVGVNVHQAERDFPEQLRARATSVAMEGGRVDEAVLLREFLAGLRRWIEPNEGLRARVLLRYRELCSTLGRRVRAALGEDRAVEGVAIDIGNGGELVLQTTSRVEAIGFGEIVHLE
jgi:BirA family biotin operon repressor/biotin-[acetyl-CoA-carboxylase] ligase